MAFDFAKTFLLGVVIAIVADNVQGSYSGCEVRIASMGCLKCRKGYFGKECDKVCHCLYTGSCNDKGDRYCLYGCQEGYHGSRCEEEHPYFIEKPVIIFSTREIIGISWTKYNSANHSCCRGSGSATSYGVLLNNELAMIEAGDRSMSLVKLTRHYDELKVSLRIYSGRNRGKQSPAAQISSTDPWKTPWTKESGPNVFKWKDKPGIAAPETGTKEVKPWHDETIATQKPTTQRNGGKGSSESVETAVKAAIDPSSNEGGAVASNGNIQVAQPGALISPVNGNDGSVVMVTSDVMVYLMLGMGALIIVVIAVVCSSLMYYRGVQKKKEEEKKMKEEHHRKKKLHYEQKIKRRKKDNYGRLWGSGENKYYGIRDDDIYDDTHVYSIAKPNFEQDKMEQIQMETLAVRRAPPPPPRLLPPPVVFAGGDAPPVVLSGYHEASPLSIKKKPPSPPVRQKPVPTRLLPVSPRDNAPAVSSFTLPTKVINTRDLSYLEPRHQQRQQQVNQNLKIRSVRNNNHVPRPRPSTTSATYQRQ